MIAPAAASPYEVERDSVRLRVRLTPRGGRDAVEGLLTMSDGQTVLKARVRAVPEAGRANAALETMLAEALHAPRSAVSVVAGATGRLKTVRIAGEPARLAAGLDALCAR